MKLNILILILPLVHAATDATQSGNSCKNPNLLEDLRENGPDECCFMSYKPSCTMNIERMWHVKLFYNRKPGMSEEEFNQHLAYEHTKGMPIK